MIERERERERARARRRERKSARADERGRERERESERAKTREREKERERARACADGRGTKRERNVEIRNRRYMCTFMRERERNERKTDMCFSNELLHELGHLDITYTIRRLEHMLHASQWVRIDARNILQDVYAYERESENRRKIRHVYK